MGEGVLKGHPKNGRKLRSRTAARPEVETGLGVRFRW